MALLNFPHQFGIQIGMRPFSTLVALVSVALLLLLFVTAAFPGGAVFMAVNLIWIGLLAYLVVNVLKGRA
jgi:hypothetical protein